MAPKSERSSGPFLSSSATRQLAPGSATNSVGKPRRNRGSPLVNVSGAASKTQLSLTPKAGRHVAPPIGSRGQTVAAGKAEGSGDCVLGVPGLRDSDREV